MFSGLISLLAIVVALVVWGVVVQRWLTDGLPSRERKQRTWLFIPTYVLIIVAASLIGFLISTILQPPPPSPVQVSPVEGTIVRVPFSGLGATPEHRTIGDVARAQLKAEGWKDGPIETEKPPVAALRMVDRLFVAQSMTLGFVFLALGILGLVKLPGLAKGHTWLHRYCARAVPIFAITISLSSFCLAYQIAAQLGI